MKSRPRSTKLSEMQLQYDDSWRAWERGNSRFSPVVRHRRRVIERAIQRLPALESILEIGCGDGTLLLRLRKTRGCTALGTDISSYIIKKNRLESNDGTEWAVLDVRSEYLPAQYDLVVCSEILEHIEDDRAALENVLRMARRFVLITVPGGHRYPTDVRLGHHRHYELAQLVRLVEERSFEVLDAFSFGRPFHTWYKWLINRKPDYFYQRFAESSYGPLKRLFAEVLNALFYLNSTRSGDQLIVVAKRRDGPRD